LTRHFRIKIARITKRPQNAVQRTYIVLYLGQPVADVRCLVE
jgi:hypothetical protein